MKWFRLSDFKLYLEWGRLGFEFSQKWDMDSHGDSVSDLMWLLASVNWAKYQSATDLVPPKETTVTDLSSHMAISFFKILACVGPPKMKENNCAICWLAHILAGWPFLRGTVETLNPNTSRTFGSCKRLTPAGAAGWLVFSMFFPKQCVHTGVLMGDVKV